MQWKMGDLPELGLALLAALLVAVVAAPIWLVSRIGRLMKPAAPELKRPTSD